MTVSVASEVGRFPYSLFRHDRIREKVQSDITVLGSFESGAVTFSSGGGLAVASTHMLQGRGGDGHTAVVSHPLGQQWPFLWSWTCRL